MSEYGDFIAKGPYCSGALTSIDIAGVKTGRPGRIALKRFHPPPSGQLRRVLQREAWKTSMERQQRAARAGAAAVEVLAVGSYPEGEYAVFPWQRRSLLSIVTSVSPTGDRLRAVTRGILAALASWEEHYGSPHGNLKATNVFVTGEGLLQNLRFFLSDPSWQLGVSTAQLRRNELAQLGGLLVQMVRGREAGGVPVEDAPEWRRLGRAGLGWRDFCNFLLDPSADPSEVTLEKAETRLREIPQDFQPTRVAARSGAGVTLFVCGSALVYARLGNPRTMPNRLLWLAEKTGNPHVLRDQAVQEWPWLCQAWEGWLTELMAQSPRLEKNKELWGEADPLLAAIAVFRLDADSCRPDRLLPAHQAEGRSLDSLAKNPPESVRMEDAARDIVTSWKKVKGLQQNLDSWPRWTELRSVRDELAAAGKKDATYPLQFLVPERRGAGVISDPEFEYGALLKLSQNAAARTLLRDWKAWRSVSVELEKSRDRVQAAMPRLALQELPDTRNLGELVNSLARALQELERRRTLVASSNLARDRMLQESPLFAENTPVTQADLGRWEQEIRLFSYVTAEEDPRVPAKLGDRLAALDSKKDDLENELPAEETSAAAPFLTRTDYDSEAKRLGTEVTTLRGRVAIRRELLDLRSQTDRVEKSLQFLEQRMEATLVLLRPERWLAGVAARAWPYPAAQLRWDAWRRERLAGVSAAALDLNHLRFVGLRKEERELRAWLGALDGPAGLGGRPPLTGVSPETSQAIEKLNTTDRENAVAIIVGRSEWTGLLPKYSFEETFKPESAALGALENYRENTAKLPEFGAQLDELSRLLDQGLSWSEGVADALNKLDHYVGVNTLEGAPQTWLKEAQQLRELAATPDLDALGIAITDGTLVAAARTAWKRLGELPEWPANAAQLSREADFGVILRSKLGKLTPSSRREKWSAEVAAGQRDRWVKLARRTVQQPAQVEGVFAQSAALGVDATTLEPHLAYDLRLWGLAHQSQIATDVGQLKIARDTFVAAIKPLSGVAERREVAAFLKSIEAVPLREDSSPTLGKTPRQARWNEEVSEDGLRLIARRTERGQKLSLEYQLIEPASGPEAFFLARCTIAVGEFIALMNSDSPEAKEVLDAMPKWTRGREPPVDRGIAWQPSDSGTGFMLSRSWMPHAGPDLQGRIDDHPAELAAVTKDPPTPRSPLQYIPPEVATLFAENILGARLPTPAEWEALCREVSATPEGNFRSRAVDEVGNYAEKITLNWRPDTGAFAPSASETDTVAVRVDRPPWEGSARRGSIWPASVDDGQVTSGIIHLFGNIWVYLYDKKRNEYYVAGGSILAPRAVDVREPQLLKKHSTVGLTQANYGDGFTDVGLRPAFDAPAGVRQRLHFLRLVRNQPFITK